MHQPFSTPGTQLGYDLGVIFPHMTEPLRPRAEKGGLKPSVLCQRRGQADFSSGGGISKVGELLGLGPTSWPWTDGASFPSMSPEQGLPKAFVQSNWYLLLGCQRFLPAIPCSSWISTWSQAEGSSPRGQGE